MTPNDFLNKLKQVDVEFTDQQMILILSILSPNQPAKTEILQSGNTLINEETTAGILGLNSRTLANWRVIGRGPKFVKIGRLIKYRLSTVNDWMIKQEVQSTTQADLLAFSGMSFDNVFPSIFIDDEPQPFFDTLDEELNITGYETLWSETNSLSGWLLSVMEIGIDVDTIISELESKISGGLDINSTQSFIRNGELLTENLSHVIAKLKFNDFQDYSMLVSSILNLNADFEIKNSDGLTAIELAKSKGNENLIRMVNSKMLFDKLNSTI